MRKRSAFTMIELLVVIMVITLLAAILLHVFAHSRRESQIQAEMLDFQSISTALEHYKQDFGDYPRNPDFAGNAVPTSGNPNYRFQYYYPLSALIGPGPGVTQPETGTVYAQSSLPPTWYGLGDGANGLGVRGQTMNIPVTVSGSGNTITVTTTSTALAPPFTVGQSAWWLVLDPGSAIEQDLGVTSATFSGTTLTFNNLTTLIVTPSAASPTSSQGILEIATGKVWSNYLSPDQFGIQYALVQSAGTTPNLIYQPILMDRWGNPIQYFPSNGPSNNRGANSGTGVPPTLTAPSSTLNAAVIAGPLVGYSMPYSIDPNYGQYAIWDYRYGIPVGYPSATGTGTTYANWNHQIVDPNTAVWHLQRTPNPNDPDPCLALQWMLGDSTPLMAGNSPPLNNEIVSPDTLRYSGPYILISAGPDGVFCNLNGATLDKYQQLLQASGNIYNFSR